METALPPVRTVTDLARGVTNLDGCSTSDPVLAMLESSPPIAGDRPLSSGVVGIAAKKISDLAEVRVLSTAPAHSRAAQRQSIDLFLVLN
jgi:hypothetical protein